MEHLLDVVCGGPLLPLGPHMRKLESKEEKKKKTSASQRVSSDDRRTVLVTIVPKQTLATYSLQEPHEIISYWFLTSQSKSGKGWLKEAVQAKKTIGGDKNNLTKLRYHHYQPPVSSLRRRRPEFVTREGSRQLGRENT
nr:hypothetical protein Iba_chr05bCG4150 [Ipomoea batatas]